MACLALFLGALLQSAPASQPGADLERVLQALAAASGAERARAEQELGLALASAQVPELLTRVARVAPEVTARAVRVLAGRADLLPALFEAAGAAPDPARRELLDAALQAHFRVHRTPLPEDLGSVAALPPALFSFRAAGLSHLEVCERLDRSGRLDLPLLVSLDLARQGTWIHEPSSLPDGAVGTVGDLLASCGFAVAVPGGLPRNAPGLLWLRTDYLLAAPAQFPLPDDGALFLALLDGLRGADPVTRDVAAVDLGCLPLGSVDLLFAHLRTSGDPVRARLGDLGLAVRVARGRDDLVRDAATLVRLGARAGQAGEPRPAWFRHAARRAVERLPAPEQERAVAWLRGELAAEPPTRRMVALGIASGCPRPLREPLGAAALGAEPMAAVAALEACAGLAPAELEPLVEPLLTRLRADPVPAGWPEALGRVLTGRVPEALLQRGVPDLSAVAPGSASQCAALLLAAAGRDGTRRVVDAILAADPGQPRLPGWIEGLRLARQHGALVSSEVFLAAFARAPAGRKATVAAAFTLLADPAVEEQREGRGRFAGEMSQILGDAMARRGAFDGRVFWARAFGRFLGLLGVAPGNRRIAEVLVDQLLQPDTEEAMLAAIAAEACVEVRRGVVLDLAAALRPRRSHLEPRLAQFLELRVLRQSPLPALDLPDLLADR